MERKDLDPKVLGRYLRLQRNALDLSLEETAFQAGIDYNNLSRIERGEHYPTANTLYKLEPVLKIKISNVFEQIRKESEKE